MKKLQNLIPVILVLSFFSANAVAENLYRITLLRANPGLLPELIEVVRKQKASHNNEMVIMRHSQGDHWDLMLLSPVADNVISRFDYQQHVDFQHDFLASNPMNWKEVSKLSKDAGLFHIEMFQAARGQHKALLKERFMENEYLVATKRKANAVFVTQFGSDVDCFTIGFYPNLQAFAADPKLDEQVFEKAAKDAGFKSRSDIGFYLREFLVGHQDTLATQVR